MILNNKIIELIIKRSSLLFDKAGDFELLSMYIFKDTNRTIGATTLKRLFNYINDDRKASDYTLNTIAIYLGFKNWEQLIQSIKIDSDWGYEDDTVYIHALEVGTKIEIKYLNRNVTFVVVKRDGENLLRVENSVNSSLKIGDECAIYRISKDEVLEAEKVYRESLIGNYRTNGEIKSIKIIAGKNSSPKRLLGAIIGDIAGSCYEFNPTNDYNFELFTNESDYTDDTICTIAVADSLIKEMDFAENMHEWCRRYPYPMGGYGGRFSSWVHSDKPAPYNSFGNGAAMRVSPVAWFADSREMTLDLAGKTAAITHNHPEGIKGAQTVALAIYDARQGMNVNSILEDCVKFSGYNIELKLEDVQNKFDETCQGTVPVALWIIGQSTCFEDAIRRAISLGADADTLGAIVGSIAEAIWPIPSLLQKKALEFLSDEMKKVVNDFNEICN